MNDSFDLIVVEAGQTGPLQAALLWACSHAVDLVERKRLGSAYAHAAQSPVNVTKLVLTDTPMHGVDDDGRYFSVLQ